MRYLLIWELIFLDPQSHSLIWETGSEIHLSAWSCQLARSELRALARIRGVCTSVGEQEHPAWSTTTRMFLTRRVGKGGYVSRYEPGRPAGVPNLTRGGDLEVFEGSVPSNQFGRPALNLNVIGNQQ